MRCATRHSGEYGPAHGPEAESARGFTRLLAFEWFGGCRSASAGSDRANGDAVLLAFTDLALNTRLLVVFHFLYFLPPGLEIRALYDVARAVRFPGDLDLASADFDLDAFHLPRRLHLRFHGGRRLGMTGADGAVARRCRWRCGRSR